MHSLFISDLHLSPERPELAAGFLQFLQQQAPGAERLYILGDLFEFWIGDDAAAQVGANELLAAMKTISQVTACYFIAGNRDFLVGERFADESGFQVLDDETVIDLYGTPTLLLHGDSMCTDDVAHMHFRQHYVLDQTQRKAFLTLDIPARLVQAQEARKQSHQHKSEVSKEIMDVNATTVVKTFQHHHVQTMIHGHTHRQDIHHYDIDGQNCTRYVLGDWGSHNSVLTASPNGLEISNSAI